jgi:CRISPR-associated protein Cmr5
MRQTKEQLRAAHAWTAISTLTTESRDTQKKLAVAIKNLPVRIHASGLGQAITFLRAKEESNKEFRLLEAIVVHWLMNNYPMKYLVTNDEDDPSRRLIEKIIDGDASTLKRLTDEALAYLPWLSRFAEGAGMMKVVKKPIEQKD